ncbi:HNH endonuclease [Sorangium sp. So ce233]|uniref:HNH endonuclease n=1 Tax=Sorangium sp. So ce233 TaxID=3133290 RepID=UPI003F61CDDA
MTVTKRRTFDAMVPGDDVLMTTKGTGRFTRYAQVTFKVENRGLGEHLWPVRGERPWELIYFLRNIREIDVDKSKLVADLGYEPTFQVFGAIRVQDEMLQHFESIHGPVAEWLHVKASLDGLTSPAFDPDYADDDADYSAADITTLAKRRERHEKFATSVKNNYGWACAICGITEREFLSAGHIARWAADPLNRLNPANGICFCALHDKAFEHGFISLDDDLHIIVSPLIDPLSPLGQVIAGLARRRVRPPSASSPDRRLLAAHRNERLRR